jgi:hypothetical protein
MDFFFPSVVARMQFEVPPTALIRWVSSYIQDHVVLVAKYGATNHSILRGSAIQTGLEPLAGGFYHSKSPEGRSRHVSLCTRLS